MQLGPIIVTVWGATMKTVESLSSKSLLEV